MPLAAGLDSEGEGVGVGIVVELRPVDEGSRVDDAVGVEETPVRLVTISVACLTTILAPWTTTGLWMKSIVGDCRAGTQWRKERVAVARGPIRRQEAGERRARASID